MDQATEATPFCPLLDIECHDINKSTLFFIKLLSSVSIPLSVPHLYLDSNIHDKKEACILLKITETHKHYMISLLTFNMM